MRMMMMIMMTNGGNHHYHDYTIIQMQMMVSRVILILMLMISPHCVAMQQTPRTPRCLCSITILSAGFNKHIITNPLGVSCSGFTSTSTNEIHMCWDFLKTQELYKFVCQHKSILVPSTLGRGCERRNQIWRRSMHSHRTNNGRIIPFSDNRMREQASAISDWRESQESSDMS